MAKKLIIAVLPLLAYGLPQGPGHYVLLEDKQAEQIINDGYGCYATEEEEKKFLSSEKKRSKAGDGIAIKVDTSFLESLNKKLEEAASVITGLEADKATLTSELETANGVIAELQTKSVIDIDVKSEQVSPDLEKSVKK